jgi:hypothetical protein
VPTCIDRLAACRAGEIERLALLSRRGRKATSTTRTRNATAAPTIRMKRDACARAVTGFLFCVFGRTGRCPKWSLWNRLVSRCLTKKPLWFFGIGGVALALLRQSPHRSTLRLIKAGGVECEFVLDQVDFTSLTAAKKNLRSMLLTSKRLSQRWIARSSNPRHG